MNPDLSKIRLKTPLSSSFPAICTHSLIYTTHKPESVVDALEPVGAYMINKTVRLHGFVWLFCIFIIFPGFLCLG